MLLLLLFLLFIGLIASYYIIGKNVLSCWVLAHILYMVSVLVLVWNIKTINYDISFETIIIIMMSLLALGVGEMIAKSKYKSRIAYYPSSSDLPGITISNSKFYISIILVIIMAAYAYYGFSFVGSALGGSNFVSRYILIRGYVVAQSNLGDVEQIVIPFSGIMSYAGFFIKILVYFYVYMYLYELYFKKKKVYKYLYPLLIYIPVCLFSVTRSVFIEMFSIIAIMLFVMYKQSHKGWYSSSSNWKIFKYAVTILVSFVFVFIILGSFKEQDVVSDFAATMCGYAGASIIGLDQQVIGTINIKSDYPGQITCAGLFSLLNHLGFSFDPPPYHQDDFYYGYGGHSNIFSAPYYILIDFSWPMIIIVYTFWGYVLGSAMAKVKYGSVKPFEFSHYIILSLLYYPIIMIAITDAFRHFISLAFVYTIISAKLVEYLFVKRSRLTY